MTQTDYPKVERGQMLPEIEVHVLMGSYPGATEVTIFGSKRWMRVVHYGKTDLARSDYDTFAAAIGDGNRNVFIDYNGADSRYVGYKWKWERTQHCTVAVQDSVVPPEGAYERFVFVRYGLHDSRPRVPQSLVRETSIV